MGRSFIIRKQLSFLLIVVALAGFSACGKKSSAAPVAATVTLGTSVTSLQPGQTFFLTPRATDINGIVVVPTPAFTLIVSNPASTQNPPPVYVSIATVSTGVNKTFVGCAGQWDSLTQPTVCTPGSSGTVKITAVAENVNSNPVTIFIHPHVDQIVVAPSILPANPCTSQGLTERFTATAYSNGLDVTQEAGNITWFTTSANAATISTIAPGLAANQSEVTAKSPGSGLLYAQVASGANSTTNSAPVTFTTCPVQSISVVVLNTTNTSFALAKGGSATLTPTVIDSLGNIITNVPLTWITSRPTVVGVNNGILTASNVGGAVITAVCAPPGCNTGLSLPPVYSNLVSGTVSGVPATIVGFITGTGCTGNPNCLTGLFPFSQATSGGPITVNGSVTLPSTPNSMLVDPGGRKIFVGSYDGLMIVDPATSPPPITQPTTAVGKVTGKVLAASADGRFAIVSDTSITPNVVWIVDVANPSTNTKVLNLTGVTAAAFLPDSSKAYLVGGTSLYIYSPTAPLVTKALSGLGADVAVLGNSLFGYAAVPTGLEPFSSCDNSPAPAVTTPGSPSMIRGTADGTSIIAADSPNLDVITEQILLTGNPPSIACPPPVTHTVTSLPLGEGNFTVRKMEVGSDSKSVFLVTNEFASIFLYNLGSQTVRALPLTGGPGLLDAAVSSDGGNFVAGADDGKIHYITLQAGDIEQIPVSPCGGGGTISCNPDLVVIRP